MHQLQRSSLFIMITAFMLSCSIPNQSSHYQLIYKNDGDGNVLFGSKKALIDAIRLGATVRVGWGSNGENHSIEHVSDPIWIAVLDEKEVIVHLDPQVLSKVDWDNSTVDYADSTLLTKEWRVAITTKGEFDAVWIDRQTHDVTERRPQNHIMSWFVKDVDLSQVSEPFFIED